MAQNYTEIQRIKQTVRERDGLRCTQCGMTTAEHFGVYGRALDVHRVVPGSLYSLEGCVTICRRCHGPKPKRKPGEPDLAIPFRGFLLPARVSDGLWNVLKALAHEERRSMSETILLLLEEALSAEGLWPPSEEEKDK